MDLDELKREIERRDWFHTLEVEPGVWTKGHYEPHPEWFFSMLGAPMKFKGKRTLDIGCADGAFSYWMARNGAKRVTALDLFSPNYRNVEFLASYWNLPIDYVQETIYRFEDDPYDLVLASGVLYHLEHPLLGLQCMNRLTKTFLLIESHVEDSWLLKDQLLCKFWPGKELNNDPSNWWTPTPKCLLAMMRSAGFKPIRWKRHARHRMAVFARKVEEKPPAFTVDDVYIRYYGQKPY